jgi:AGZA family xanthine/uracil permease-like MFS transporter
VGNQATLVGPGELGSMPAALTFGGIILAGVLVARRVPGAIVISILAITFIGFFIPDGKGGAITAFPDFSNWLPASPAPTFFALDFKFLLEEPLKALPIVATLLIVDMFDNIGTLIGVTKRAGLLRPDGTLPKAGPALVADSIATILSSLFGTSTVVSYIESAAGVEAGGRTGLTSVTTAVLFLAALLLTPIILIIPAAATAPALVIVGVFMFREIADLDLSDFTQSMPVVVTVLTIPLTFSIAEGLALGVISYVLLAVATGRARQVNAFSYGLAGIFVVHLFHGLVF